MTILIIGSGMAGILFAEEFKKYQPDSRVSVLTRETHGYYSRPMLSHGFSREDVEAKIVLKSFEALRETGIDVIPGADVARIDRNQRQVEFSLGGEARSAGYDTLVIAAGSDALVPGPFRAAGCPYFVVNSLDDLIALRRLRADILGQQRVPRWAVIGGGLIGCEVASDLAKSGDRVSLFHALPRLMERQLVEADSASLLDVLRAQGIDVFLDAAVQGFQADDTGYSVQLATGAEAGFDAVIVACGFKPRVELAKDAGLAVNRGVLVNDYLQTDDPAIHALGDCAECLDGRIYAYVMPIRHQALWLGRYLGGQEATAWAPPEFKPRAKVHGFTAAHPYL